MMDTEHNGMAGAPFQEECNTARFFTGGGRGAILDDIKAALASDVDIVTLIGEEGSGKTMLCHMIREQLDDACKVIFLPQIVGSFEAIVRIVARECGVPYPEETSRADARKIFLDMVTILRIKGTSLLLINDEAENMYLATLERLRKILDDVNADGGGLQLFFAGRKGLRASLDQLTICEFVEVSEKQFFLSALDDNDTCRYLNFCVQDPEQSDPQEVFTMEAASKIASMGRGNLRVINVFAGESLKSSSADTSRQVLLDHVNDDGDKESLIPRSSGMMQLPFPQKYLFAGVFVCFLLLLVVLFSGGEDEELATEELAPIEEVVVIDIPEPVPAEKVDSVVEEIIEDSEEQVESMPVVVGPVVVEPFLVEPVAVVQEPEPEIEEAPVVRQPVAISPVKIVDKKESLDPQVPVLVAQSKISLGKTKYIVVQPEKQKPVSIPVVIPQSPRVSDPSLLSLVSAGERWLAGKEDTHFSIQLMSLQSEQAEENLKRIVAQADYQTVLSKLVLLKRPSDPPVLLVFYGLYPDMAAARNARNNMPIFLRDRHPYPVSVRGAVEKARLW